MTEKRNEVLRRMKLEAQYNLRSRVNNAINKVLPMKLDLMRFEIAHKVPLDDLELEGGFDCEEEAREVHKVIDDLIDEKIKSMIRELPLRFPFMVKWDTQK